MTAFYFCKKKSASEMRISDLSSDVCSSDLLQLLNAYHAMRTDDPISERRAMAAAQAHPPPPDSSAGLMLTSIRCHELVYAGDFDAVREAARQRFRSGDGRRAVVPLVDFWVGLSYLLDGRIALRSEERRVGKGGVSTCRSRWSPDA